VGGRCARIIRHTHIHIIQIQEKINQIILDVYFDTVLEKCYLTIKMKVR
jgi:hypothetical protein